MRAVLLCILLAGLTGACACRTGGDRSKAAVQQAIEEHLKERPNVSFEKMTMEIGEVTFNGDSAEAMVKFRSKEAPGFAVGVLYKLRRVGDGWQVESTSSASMPGTSPHGNAATPIPSTTNPPDLGPQPSH